jgi:hypothetical protein
MIRVVRVRRNRSPIGRRRTFTRDGFPWPVRTRVFHATSALDAIAHEGFRTRAQGVSSALGGNWGRSVSFTLSWPRAGAIALGLDTLVRGARKVMSCVELAERLLDEVPESLVWGVKNGNLQGIATASDDRTYFKQLVQALSYLDRGWWMLSVFPGSPRPEARGAMHISHREWLIPSESAPALRRRAAASGDLYLWTDYVKAFYELYRSPLSTANNNQ